MSQIIAFLEQHLLGMMESAVVAHEPELQADFLKELKVMSQKAQDWIDAKIVSHNKPAI